jgi:hypothetical protein
MVATNLARGDFDIVLPPHPGSPSLALRSPGMTLFDVAKPAPLNPKRLGAIKAILFFL